MRNFDAYVTNIVYGIIILLGYSFCGIIPTALGIVTWFAAGKLLESRFEERKAELISVAAGIAAAVICALIMKKLLAGG